MPFFCDAKNRRFGLGSGLSGCPKARSRRSDAGVGPVRLFEKTFWGDSLGGARRLRSLPLFWRWGLARRASRNNFPGDGGRNGRFINQKRTNDQICRFGLRMAEFIISRTSRLSLEPFLEVCPKARSRRFDAAVARRASRENFLGDGRSFCDSLGGARRSRLALGAGPLGFPKQLSGRRPKLPQQSWQPRAVARARSVILALGSGPPKHFGAGEWPDGLPETSFQRRKAGGCWTPPRETWFQVYGPAYGRFINNSWGPGQWPQWTFYRFHIVPYKQFINGQVEAETRPGRVAHHFSRREESSKVWAWVWPVGLPESSFPSF